MAILISQFYLKFEPLNTLPWFSFLASGADTPVWLAIEAEPDQVHGQFVRDRVVTTW